MLDPWHGTESMISSSDRCSRRLLVYEVNVVDPDREPYTLTATANVAFCSASVETQVWEQLGEPAGQRHCRQPPRRASLAWSIRSSLPPPLLASPATPGDERGMARHRWP